LSSPEDYDAIGRLILYGGIAVGVIVALYYAVTQLITGGGQAFLNSYNSGLQVYVAKMDRYAGQNNGVLTQAQIASKDFEEKQLVSLAGNAASAFNGVWNWLGGFVLVGTLAALAYGVFKHPDVVTKWKDVLSNPSTQPKSPKAQCIMLDCALVDELAAEGLPVEASNLLMSLQATWASVDAPYMQQQVVSLQGQISAGILSGVELDLATYFIEAYTFELSMMPTVLTLPLVPP
jgi:hypothetical protein